MARRFARLRRLAVDLYREEPLRGKTGSVLDQSSRSQVRHFQVADIPRTKRGKIVELAVRQAVHDEPIKNTEALANPEALEQFRNRPELAG